MDQSLLLSLSLRSRQLIDRPFLLMASTRINGDRNLTFAPLSKQKPMQMSETKIFQDFSKSKNCLKGCVKNFGGKKSPEVLYLVNQASDFNFEKHCRCKLTLSAYEKKNHYFLYFYSRVILKNSNF